MKSNIKYEWGPEDTHKTKQNTIDLKTNRTRKIDFCASFGHRYRSRFNLLKTSSNEEIFKTHRQMIYMPITFKLLFTSSIYILVFAALINICCSDKLNLNLYTYVSTKYLWRRRKQSNTDIQKMRRSEKKPNLREYSERSADISDTQISNANKNCLFTHFAFSTCFLWFELRLFFIRTLCFAYL